MVVVPCFLVDDELALFSEEDVACFVLAAATNAAVDIIGAHDDPP